MQRYGTFSCCAIGDTIFFSKIKKKKENNEITTIYFQNSCIFAEEIGHIY